MVNYLRWTLFLAGVGVGSLLGAVLGGIAGYQVSLTVVAMVAIAFYSFDPMPLGFTVLATASVIGFLAAFRFSYNRLRQLLWQ